MQSFDGFNWKKEFFTWKSWLNKKEKSSWQTKETMIEYKSFRTESKKQVDNWITKQPRTFNSIEISGPEASDVGKTDPWKRTKFEPKTKQ